MGLQGTSQQCTGAGQAGACGVAARQPAASSQQCRQTPTCTSRWFSGPAHEPAGIRGPDGPRVSCQGEASSVRAAWEGQGGQGHLTPRIPSRQGHQAGGQGHPQLAVWPETRRRLLYNGAGGGAGPGRGSSAAAELTTPCRGFRSPGAGRRAKGPRPQEGV